MDRDMNVYIVWEFLAENWGSSDWYPVFVSDERYEAEQWLKEENEINDSKFGIKIARYISVDILTRPSKPE